jgi:predicted GNAT superfamily acetyltransferase
MLKFLGTGPSLLLKFLAPGSHTFRALQHDSSFLQCLHREGERLCSLRTVGMRSRRASLTPSVAAYIVADTNELGVDISAVSAGILVYNMCTQEAPDRFSMQLRERYTGTLSALVGAYSESLVTDLTASWRSYSLFFQTMSEIFAYVDRIYVSQQRLPTLQAVALPVFRTAVDDAYSSRELAAAALDACSAIRDDDKQRLVAAKA